MLAAIVAVAMLFDSSATAASKPKNATAQCADGTYSTAKTRQGACSRHGGVQTWFGETTGAPTPSPAATIVRPQNATARCKDGTYSTAATKQGACSQHGGISIWLAQQRELPPPPVSTSDRPIRPAAPPAPMASGTTPAPQNATAKCKDGTLSFSKTHRGACSHHGGVAEWYK
jgi:hypothetical protein